MEVGRFGPQAANRSFDFIGDSIFVSVDPRQDFRGFFKKRKVLIMCFLEDLIPGSVSPA
jgi:hypothetical protein